jgi:hypothetical protein
VRSRPRHNLCRLSSNKSKQEHIIDQFIHLQRIMIIRDEYLETVRLFRLLVEYESNPKTV